MDSTTNTAALNQPRVFNGTERDRLVQLINEGTQVMREIEDLRGGLNDTVKALAAEFEVKPSVLKKAIRVAYRAEWDREELDHAQLDNILTATGNK